MNWQEFGLNAKNIARDWQKIEQDYPEANFLQSPAWGRVNELVGHKVIILYFKQGLPKKQDYSVHQGWCLMIVKNAKRGRYLEIPGGPLMNWNDEKVSGEVFEQIKAIAKREKCVFIRLRPQLRCNEENLRILSRLGMQKAPMHLHAEHTVILDLEQSEDELLKAMRRQTRYEVRRSAKLGMKVEYGTDEAFFREFHQVQLQTAERQHFVPPDLKMLLAEREAFGKNARMYLARTAENEPVAYGLILISGTEAEYFEAASTDLNHKLPGSYALQWQVIRDLKDLGIKHYNLWGIAPPGQKGHRYAGVTVFKTGFGGEVVEYVPAQDIVINKGRYLLNKVVEDVRKKVRHL